MRYKHNNKKGQILLITLFILTIMAILLALTIRIVLVDTRQADSNEDFDILYNVSENITQEYVLSAADTTLTETLNSCEGDGVTVNLFTVECNFDINRETLVKGSVTPGKDVNTTVRVSDKSIVEIDLAKDQAYAVELTSRNESNNGFISFDSDIYVEWPGRSPIAVEVILTYFVDVVGPTTTDLAWDSSVERLETVYGVFNEDMTVEEPVNTIGVTRAATKDTDGFWFNIRSAIQTATSDPNAVPKSMIIIPRMNDASRTFTIRSYIASDHNNDSTFPIQMRELIVSTFDPEDPDSPVASVTTLIPKYLQLDTLFYYSLLSEESLVLP